MEVLAPEVASGSKSPFGPEPLVRKLRKVSWYFRPALFPSIERGILSDNQTKTPPKTPPFFSSFVRAQVAHTSISSRPCFAVALGQLFRGGFQRPATSR